MGLGDIAEAYSDDLTEPAVYSMLRLLLGNAEQVSAHPRDRVPAAFLNQLLPPMQEQPNPVSEIELWRVRKCHGRR